MAIKTEVTLAPVEDNTPSQAVESPQLDETQKQVKDLIQEKIVIQPIIQPVQITDDEKVQVEFSTIDNVVGYTEIISKAERLITQRIGQPIVSKIGLNAWFWYSIPTNITRPQNYVVVNIVKANPTWYANNKADADVWRINFTIQGMGINEKNWTEEIENDIYTIAEQWQTETGEVSDIFVSPPIPDVDANIFSRALSFDLTLQKNV